jgi:tRNA-Thr(GGU) m(6)t(6)A37 methyltransferase TsaA
VIKSPYKDTSDAPKQGKLKDTIATIIIDKAYAAGMKGLEELSHIIVFYWANQSSRKTLITSPPWSDQTYGVFALRSPHRPNPINMCVCEIVSIDDNKIQVKHLDAIDGSAVLDIKVYSTDLDCYPEAITRNDNNIMK